MRRLNPSSSATVATLLAAAVLLTLLGHKPLTDWDEGIYAEVAREMVGGSWLVPHWNVQLWFEKPPLLMWITAVFFKLFGVSEFCARAASALSGVAVVGIAHHWLARRGEALAAWLSTLMLLATTGFLHVAHVGETDVQLSLGCCVALIGLVRVDEAERSGWVIFWAGFAAAVMTKGAAAVVLPITAAILAGALRWRTDRFGVRFWLGLALFLALVLPWHVAMYRLFGGEFLGEYFGLHVMMRATEQIEGHATHWWYYGKVLLVSAQPFVWVYPAAVWYGWRRRALRVWVVFAAVVVIFFSIVETRLPHYIAPVYPALAVVTAVYVADKVKALASQARSRGFWVKLGLATATVWVGGVLVTSNARKGLHSATLADGTVVRDNRDSIALLRDAFARPQPIGGPLLLWREGRMLSMATDVFYSSRRVQQVEVGEEGAGIARDRYTFNPLALGDAVSSEPRLILLDKALVAQIPAGYRYTSIESGGMVELGSIVRRP